MTTQQKGVVTGLASGLTWAVYTVLIYELLNPYAGCTGGIDSFHGMLLIVTAALVIGICESCCALVIELSYLRKLHRFKEFLRILFSKDGFGIIPAVIFSGLLGAVPYSIASSFSTSVAGTISAAFPAIGAIVAVIWFKEKLTPLKFIGIILCIVGTGIMYGLATGSVPFFVYLISIITAIGYAMEGCFGYNLMRSDVHSSVAVALRRVYAILLNVILVVLISAFTGNFQYLLDFVSGFTVNSAVYPWLSGMEGNWLFFALIFFLGAGCNGASYIFWYYSFNFSGVATAQVLNITYGIFIILLVMLPPFLSLPAWGSILGALVLFGGAAIVTRETTKQPA
ncbi:MAG TPA: hypothetical protein PKD52_06015 [Clostridiales bacterium]|nr:hypothetical protein [Clostridiales bacterium]